MAIVTPPSFSTPATAPDRTDRSTFSTRAATWATYQGTTLNSEFSALASNIANNATEAYTQATVATEQKVAAEAAKTAAQAASTAAAATVNATKWISGTSYTTGQCVWSPTDYLVYRRKTNGAGTTDPISDGTNWTRLLTTGTAGTWITKTSNYTALAGDAIYANTTGGSFTVTLPASPVNNDTIKIADYASYFNINKLTVARNGKKIMGLSEDMDIQTQNISITLVYVSATTDWRLV